MNRTADYAGEGIYREFILDHYKNPRNSGSLKNPTFSHREFNPLCGDDITFYVRTRGSAIEDIKFRGTGCAISQASASMLSERLKGRSLEEAMSMTRKDILDMIGISLGPARIKCAMLGLAALKKGIEKFREEKHG
jgi:nitrogen fixation NifU-like protein